MQALVWNLKAATHVECVPAGSGTGVRVVPGHVRAEVSGCAPELIR